MPFLIFIFITIFGGCSSHTPAITHYTIAPSYSKTQTKDPKSSKALHLITTETLSSINTKAIRYTLPSHESGHYLYGKWSDTPSSMMNRYILSYLESQHLFHTLLSTSSHLQSDWILESELLTFEHRFYNNGPSQGEIDVFFRLINTKTKQPIATKRFTVAVASKSESLAGGVEALESALSTLSRELAEWLKLQLE